MELQKLIDGLKAHRNGAASYESVDEAIRVFEAMRDVDGDKVCKGLECCYMDKSPKHCEGCPYNMDNEGCGHDTFALERDALALIRQQQERIKELEAAQTARVMTLEEIPLFDGAIYMDEYPNPVCLKMLYCYEVGRGTYGHGYTFVDSDGDKIFFPAKEFGKKWRCWTQRPTDEQRKAVKWNG